MEASCLTGRRGKRNYWLDKPTPGKCERAVTERARLGVTYIKSIVKSVSNICV